MFTAEQLDETLKSLIGIGLEESEHASKFPEIQANIKDAIAVISRSQTCAAVTMGVIQKGFPSFAAELAFHYLIGQEKKDVIWLQILASIFIKAGYTLGKAENSATDAKAEIEALNKLFGLPDPDGNADEK